MITIETHRRISPTLQYLFELRNSLYTKIVTTRCSSYSVLLNSLIVTNTPFFYVEVGSVRDHAR